MRAALILIVISLSHYGLTQNLYRYYGDVALDKYESGDFEGAMSYLNRMIKLYPDSTFPYLLLGGSHHSMGNLDGAVKNYSKALEMGDSSALAIEKRSVAYLQMNQYSLAEADMKTGLRLYPLDTLLMINLGGLYSQQSRFEETLLILDTMDSFSQNYLGGYFIRGFANQSLERFETAIIDYKQLIQIDSSGSPAYLRLAECYKALGRNTEMCETLRDCLERYYLFGQEFHDWDCGTILNYIPMPPPQEVIIKEVTTSPKTD